MKDICEKGKCTACGACENICPISCVIRLKDVSNFRMVKGKECIGCGICEKVCPVANEVELHYPLRAFIGQNNDKAVRNNSASGGIASGIYQYAENRKELFVGAFLDEKFDCHLKIGSKKDDIEQFRNSKYTYCYPDSIYKNVASEIKKERTIYFIGLPCQVAAVKKYFEVLHISRDNLYTIDIICHGTPDPEYLKQHIASIACKMGKNVQKCLFRDPQYGTTNFVYSLYDDNQKEPFYAKYVRQNDLYQIGYHDALIYRDSCYTCKFAKPYRAGDITIGDYHVQTKKLLPFDSSSVSTILVNTDKGMTLLESLKQTDVLELIEQSLDDPLKGEKQLQYPSVSGEEREVFLRIYSKENNYEAAARVAFKLIVINNILHIDEIKRFIKKCLKRCLHFRKRI